MDPRDAIEQDRQRKYETVRRFVLGPVSLLARQGCVVEAWRRYRGRKLGPYYRLAYREHGRQRSIYLGRSVQLADRVRALLQECQARVHQQRAWHRLRAQGRSELARSLAVWRRELARVGLRLQGSEVRGWRALTRAAKSGVSEPVVIKD